MCNGMWNAMWNVMWNTMLKCNVEILVVNTDNVLILNLLWHNISHLRNSIRTIHYQITPWNTLSKPLRKYYLIWNKQRNATENSNCTFATWLSTGGLTFEITPRICACECHILLYIIAKQGWRTEGGSGIRKLLVEVPVTNQSRIKYAVGYAGRHEQSLQQHAKAVYGTVLIWHGMTHATATSTSIKLLITKNKTNN